MFERFTDRARRVVVFAQEEARVLQHDFIGTEHLLLGLIREGEGIAARSLAALGVESLDVRRRVEDIVGQGRARGTGHIPFTPRAKKVLELSLREALQLGQDYIGTEHILLGLLREGEGVAAQVLRQVGVDLGRARAQVIQLLSGMGVAAGAEGEPVVGAPVAGVAMMSEGPRCPHCRTPLVDALAIQTIAAEGADEPGTDVRIVSCGTCGCALGVVP